MKPSGWFWRLPILIVILALIVYLYIQLRQQREVLSAFDKNQQQLVLQIADLNDRLVATARQQELTAPVPDTITSAASNQLARQSVRQGLLLAQAALDVGQADDALVLLSQTRHRLADQAGVTLAPALITALNVRIAQDIKQVSDVGQKKQLAGQARDVAYARLQQFLTEMARRGPVLVAEQTSNSALNEKPVDPSSLRARLSHLIRVEPAEAGPQASIAIRALMCHEVALTLGLARQALQQQQMDQELSLVREAQHQIRGLADVDARRVDALLRQLLLHPIPAPVRLQSLQLLPDQTSAP
jgi:hypothetical protein